MNVILFKQIDGSTEFICIDCGAHVRSAVYINAGRRCMNCQFIHNNPALSDDTKRILRPAPRLCRDCSGTGRLSLFSEDDGRELRSHECPTCMGSGAIEEKTQ